jgi:hypothetical protein
MQPLNSSNLDSAGFDPETGTLVVQFKSGKSYRWIEVTQDIYDSLMEASSPGRYFNEFIAGKFGRGDLV